MPSNIQGKNEHSGWYAQRIRIYPRIEPKIPIAVGNSLNAKAS
jgi:hypothetical protein